MMGYGCAMTAKRYRLSLVLALAGASAVGISGCGDEGDGEPGTEQVTAELTIVVTHPDHPTIEYQLACDTHESEISGDDTDLDATTACQALTDQAVLDRLVLGAPTGRVCAEVFGGPDVASISGVIEETPVATIVDRTNACMIEDWDELLGDLLPQPRDELG